MNITDPVREGQLEITEYKLLGKLPDPFVRDNGTRLTSPTLNSLPTASIATGLPFTVHVWYTCSGYVESYGWGGMHFDNDMSYNLGVGFVTDPHVLGRAFFPCRDNFTDKATYTFRVKTRIGWTAECGGMLQSRVANYDGTENSVWHIALRSSPHSTPWCPCSNAASAPTAGDA